MAIKVKINLSGYLSEQVLRQQVTQIPKASCERNPLTTSSQQLRLKDGDDGDGVGDGARPMRPGAKNQLNQVAHPTMSLHVKLKTENFPGWRDDCRLAEEVGVTTSGSRDFRQRMPTVMKKVRYHCSHLRHVHTLHNMRQVRHLVRLMMDTEVPSLRMLLSTPRKDWRPVVVAAVAAKPDIRLSNFHQMRTSNRVTQMMKLPGTKSTQTSQC